MLHTYILSRNHFAVEHYVLSTILTVVLLNQSKDTLYKVQVVIVRSNLQPHELSSLNQSVDTDGKILTADIDITSIKQRQHTVLLQFLQVLIVSQLYLMAEIDNFTKILQVVLIVVYSILYATVQVDSEYTL